MHFVFATTRRHAMRPIRVLVFFPASSPAFAHHIGQVPGFVPAECRAVAYVPPDAAITRPALAAHVSIASCLAEVRFSQIPKLEPSAMAAALDNAARDSMTMLDEVARA